MNLLIDTKKNSMFLIVMNVGNRKVD